MTRYFGKLHKTYALIGGGAVLLSALCLCLTVGSPLPILRLLGAGALLPPLWIVGLLWLFGYALAGASAGYVLACAGKGASRSAHGWRGVTFLTLEVTLSFAWYSLLFQSFLLLPSWFCLLLAVGAGFACTLSWFSVSRPAAVASGGLTLWFFCLLLIQLAVMLGC